MYFYSLINLSNITPGAPCSRHSEKYSQKICFQNINKNNIHSNRL